MRCTRCHRRVGARGSLACLQAAGEERFGRGCYLVKDCGTHGVRSHELLRKFGYRKYWPVGCAGGPLCFITEMSICITSTALSTTNAAGASQEWASRIVVT